MRAHLDEKGFDEARVNDATVPHRHDDEPWLDEDVGLPRDGPPIRAIATVIGVTGVSLVMGIGLWVRHGGAELGETLPPEAPAPPLHMDTLLTMQPFDEATTDGATSAGDADPEKSAGETGAEGRPSATASEGEPHATRFAHADARASERARSLAITNAATDELNRYELAKVRGDPRPLDEIKSEALRAILAEEEGDDGPTSDTDAGD